MKPLGYVARFRGGATPDTGKPEYWDGDIPWLSPKDMKRPVIEDSEDHVSAEALRNGPLSMIPPDAVLIVVRGMILAHTFPVALTGGPVTINQDMKALVVAQVLQPRFLFWALRGFANALVALADESAHGTRKLETFTLSRFPILLPPSREQRAIADFLDRETAKLDTLVAKKRALIEKLKEKRTALISRTVTRGLPAEAAAKAGLDPLPKLKPSGIDWLGDVPEHWDVKPVKFVARVGNGSTPSRGNTDFWLEGDYPWLNSSVVNLEEVTEPTELVTEAALHQCHLPRITPPAVLIGITGEGKTRGMATTLQIEATINQHLAFVKPRDARCEVRYLRRVFDRAYQFLRNESDGGGSTKGAMTCEQIASLRIPIPPYAEQRTIADYLDRETAKIDRMVAKVEEAIERLQEYRTALITAAVTGKIDVRGAVHDREASVPEPNKARVLA
ncbi:MAG: restriction endonuclease subunit S [Deltaproteobacteria bacterium]|nr:restriction endonuclease subunit S [Deltaproteobacteria bacterium]